MMFEQERVGVERIHKEEARELFLSPVLAVPKLGPTAT